MKGHRTVIFNRKASYNFFLYEQLVAGIVLEGSEIKSIRGGKVSINEAFCVIKGHEVFIKNMYIAQHTLFDSADTRRERKLLLTRQEILKIKTKLLKNMTLVPVEVFLDSHNRAKINISLAKGKKNYDKRRAIKERDEKRMIAMEKD